MNNKEVAHLWANQSRPSASGSHFHYSGDTIYSYAMPVARHFKSVVLFTRQGYSSTTAIHKGMVQSAANHLTVFKVEKPTNNPGKADVLAYADDIKRGAIAAARARNADSHLSSLQTLVDEANAFCAHFGFSTRFSMPANLDELKAKAKLSAERERKAKAAAQARLEKEQAKSIAGWIAGDADCYVSDGIGRVYLRAKDAKMQTSKGALVPLDEAHKAYRFIRLHRTNGWHRNGDVFKVGDYQLDAVNEQGVVAGCHRIEWQEIERFAATQGWTQ